MAHFAELDKNNKVIRVVVIDNNDVNNNGGDQSETAAKAVEKIVPFTKDGVKWIQTSYNNNFRKQYAGIGDTYDSIKDKFIAPQPYPSWTLDENDDWKSPLPFPTIWEETRTIEPVGLTYYHPIWEEQTKLWLGVDQNNKKYTWDSVNKIWIPD